MKQYENGKTKLEVTNNCEQFDLYRVNPGPFKEALGVYCHELVRNLFNFSPGVWLQ